MDPFLSFIVIVGFYTFQIHLINKDGTLMLFTTVWHGLVLLKVLVLILDW